METSCSDPEGTTTTQCFTAFRYGGKMFIWFIKDTCKAPPFLPSFLPAWVLLPTGRWVGRKPHRMELNSFCPLIHYSLFYVCDYAYLLHSMILINAFPPNACNAQEGALWVQIREMSLLAGKELQRLALAESNLYRKMTSIMALLLSLVLLWLIPCRCFVLDRLFRNKRLKRNIKNLYILVLLGKSCIADCFSGFAWVWLCHSSNTK